MNRKSAKLLRFKNGDTFATNGFDIKVSGEEPLEEIQITQEEFADPARRDYKTARAKLDKDKKQRIQ